MGHMIAGGSLGHDDHKMVELKIFTQWQLMFSQLSASIPRSYSARLSNLVALHGIVVTEVQDPALGLVESHTVVRDHLYQMNVHKFIGPDGIHLQVLKELADVMAGPVSIIYQRSWESGEVPADWKLTNVIPIYRECVREDPGNYRPVSLTSLPGKIMEKIILNATDRHFKKSAFVRHSQRIHKGKVLFN